MLSLHHAVVGCGTAKRDAVSLVVGAHACKGAAPGHSTFEMVDVRRFEIGACRLIVASIFVQPRNWIRIGTAVCSRKRLIREGGVRGGHGKREEGRGTRF